MGKKYFNWLGCVLIIVYVLILLVLILIGLNASIYKWYIYGFAIVWGSVVIAIIPTTLNLTSSKILPEKREYVRMISKSVREKRFHVQGIPRVVLCPFLTFEFPNGVLLEFNVKSEIFNAVSENDVGMLTYKHQGKILLYPV